MLGLVEFSSRIFNIMFRVFQCVLLSFLYFKKEERERDKPSVGMRKCREPNGECKESKIIEREKVKEKQDANGVFQ